MNKKIIKPTPFGSLAIIWRLVNNNPKITRILLSNPGLSADDKINVLYPNSQTSSAKEIDNIATSIQGFLEGDKIEFSLDITDLSVCSDFQKLVLRAEHRIPWGSVSNYQRIASYVGKEKGIRAVGNSLAKNPFPILVPCHRVVRSNRYLGGFQGGIEMKRALLENEGIPFDDMGRVVCLFFHY